MMIWPASVAVVDDESPEASSAIANANADIPPKQRRQRLVRPLDRVDLQPLHEERRRPP